ncbi:MAG: lipoprotein-releasing ABC transporter permease subunit, partial [Alphaproteobacteria bacterium]|nr:lipoprotein-releasing ABC transporter permease subunit [Alphaproteobacteria bacterium]
IALGVATLIIVMSVMNGFRAELLGRILGINGHLAVVSQTANLADFDKLAQQVKDVPGVVAIVPQVDGQVMARTEGQASGALIRGIRPEDVAKIPSLAGHASREALAAFKDDAVLVGVRLAQRLGLRPGGEITLISPQGNATPFGTVPRIKAYTVAGTFDVGMAEYDSSIIFMPLAEAQLFFKHPDGVSSLEVFVNDPDRSRTIGRQILDRLPQGDRIIDWQQANSSIFTAVQVERNVMFLILTLIIVVAAFNIISSMIMMVKDKGRDIAILRTMGATRGMVLRIFMLSGASIGIVGTIAGFALGLSFAENIEAIRQFVQRIAGVNVFDPTIYFLSQMPSKVEPMEVVTVVLMALGLSFLATLYPSWRAARLDPVEALRYE